MENSSNTALTELALPSETEFSFLRTSNEEKLKNLNFNSNESLLVMKKMTICQSSEPKILLSNYNNDHHSSEEELEVINSPKIIASYGCRPATAPEKRKWSQISNGDIRQKHYNQAQKQKQEQVTQQTQRIASSVDIIATCSAPVSRAGTEAPGSGSSDEEVAKYT